MTGENNKAAPYKLWLNIADRAGWVLEIPDGSIGPDNFRGWNDCRADAVVNPKTDDVKFLDKLVDTVANRYPIDTSRLYVHGTSNGGHMTYRLAEERGSKYRAIAAIVAAMPVRNKCHATNDPVSVLVMNGTADPLVSYRGGRVGGRNPSGHQRGSVNSTAIRLDTGYA